MKKKEMGSFNLQKEKGYVEKASADRLDKQAWNGPLLIGIHRYLLVLKGPWVVRHVTIADPIRHAALVHGFARRAVKPGKIVPSGYEGNAIGMAPEPSRALAEAFIFLPHLKHDRARSEEHTSELQSLMRISYAVFCLKKKITKKQKETIKK